MQLIKRKKLRKKEKIEETNGRSRVDRFGPKSVSFAFNVSDQRSVASRDFSLLSSVVRGERLNWF